MFVSFFTYFFDYSITINNTDDITLSNQIKKKWRINSGAVKLNGGGEIQNPN